MEKWAIIVMIILLILIIAIVVVVFFLQRNNTHKNQNNILYPFTGLVDANGIVNLTSSIKDPVTGQQLPQIDCSVASGKNGGKINIVASFTDMNDPYGSCSPNSSSILNLTCGIPTKDIKCRVDADCGVGMGCKQGFCTPAQAVLNKDGKTINTKESQCGGNYCPVQPSTACTSDSDCGGINNGVMFCDLSNPGNGKGLCQVIPGNTCMGVNIGRNTCASFPLCSYANIDANQIFGTSVTKTVSNFVCMPSQTETKCRPRDSSAYLASICDGKETCNSIFDLSKSGSGFGPLPCSIPNGQNIYHTLGVNGTNQYSKMPLTPEDGSNYNQGFYVHGLYSCVV